MIRASGTPKMQFRHLSSASERRPEAIEQWMQATFSEPFDLVQGPLYRVNVLRRDADDHLLVLTIHHAIADGWSLGALFKISAPPTSRGWQEGPMGFHQCISRIVRGGRPSEPFGGVLDRSTYSLLEIQLAGAQRLLTTPVDLHAMATPLKRLVTHLPVDLGRAARDLARRHGVTLFSTLLTIFRIALSRWMDAHDVVVGTPVANRSKPSIARPWAIVQAWSHFETRSSMIVHSPIVCAPSIRHRSIALRTPFPL